LGLSAGDFAMVISPKGEDELEILEISYIPIP
jgi:transcription elongation GreA/GreB family factor